MVTRLPIDECVSQVVDGLLQEQAVILQAPPGAGKTTGIPSQLVKARITTGEILLIEPRRVAARAAARRLSQLAGTRLGSTYGYHVRFDRKTCASTRVIAMTPGMFLRRLDSDAFLESVGCVVLDEFHERSLEVDLALGMLHRLRSTVRPELKLIVMSATLETKSLSEMLTDSITITSEGRSFPVEIDWSRTQKGIARRTSEIAQLMSEKILHVANETRGNLLAFLPGVGEIKATADLLSGPFQRTDMVIHQLYGDLAPEKQDRVIAPSERRKIVLATNVAETSITIDGVTAVVDSGLARTMQYDPSVGVPKLELGLISQASAAQRAGRAGRTQPGKCYRLWNESQHRSRPDHTPPEIVRTDLSGALLSLAIWGERDVLAFPWVTAPAQESVSAATSLLQTLGAIDVEGVPTETGRRMSQLPLHPRLARMVVEAEKLGCLPATCLVAAMLSERNALSRDAAVELIDRMGQLKTANESLPGIKQVRRVAEQLLRTLGEDSVGLDGPIDTRSLERSVLAAYRDRIVQRRSNDPSRGRMVGGKGIRLKQPLASDSSGYFIAVDLDGRGSEAQARLIVSLEGDRWLEHVRLSRRRRVDFDKTRAALVAREQQCIEDLIVKDTPAELIPDEHTAEVLYAQAHDRLEHVLPADDQTLQSLIARWRYRDEIDTGFGGPKRDAKEQPAPPSVDTALQETLRELCVDRISFAELRQAPWIDYLRAQFGYNELTQFDQEFPEKLRVPSGNEIRLRYRPGKPPLLAVRIQELFGWSETPRIAGGRIKLQLELLGPNRRPQQITDDLASFWESAYVEIRKELRRRYSKHHWPENPVTATATRNGIQPNRIAKR
ncbi:MAG: ATP-dependent helicase HrpB [Planctomycetota bacterium]